MSMSELTVPTGETSSVAFWMNGLVASRYPVMLCVCAGQGKTQLINGLLGESYSVVLVLEYDEA